MTLTAIIGALMALLPKPEKPVQSPVDSEVDRLTRSHARLVDHIERLERELLLEQHLCTHWREAAQRIAKQSREEREQLQQAARDWQGRAMQWPVEALLYQQQQAQGQLAACQNVQNQQSQFYGQGLPQLLDTQWQGFCNCVPSRSQVWEANRGEG